MGKQTFINKEDRKDYRISWFVGVYFISSTANMTMKTVLPIPEGLWSIVSLFWGLVIVFFMLRGIKPVLSRSMNLITQSLLVFILLFGWSLLLIILRGEPTNVLTSAIAIPTFLFWLPVGIFSCSVRNMSVLYRVMLKTSYILTALLGTCFLFRNGAAVNGEDASSYNMFFGYSMAFASLFQLNEFYRTRKKVLLLLVLVQVLLVLLYANRGALLSIAFFVFFKYVMDQSSVFKKVLGISVLAVSFGVLFVYSGKIATVAVDHLMGMNIESRTLMKMAGGTISESDERDDLRRVSKEMISQRPVLGWGIGGECYTISVKMFNTPEASVGNSPHNGPLQVLLYFGVFVGIIVNIFLIMPIFKLHKIRDEYRHGIVLVCCSAYFITTLWSACDILLKPAVAIYLYLTYFYRISNKYIVNNEYNQLETKVSKQQ